MLNQILPLAAQNTSCWKSNKVALAQLRYGLLVLAFSGVTLLLTVILLQGLTTEKQDQGLGGVVKDTEIQSRSSLAMAFPRY